MTQLAFVQEHALAEAQNRIQRLEWELQQAQQAAHRRSSSRGTAAQAAGSSAACSAAGRASAPPPQGGPGPAWNQGGPQPGYQQGGPSRAISGRRRRNMRPSYQPGMFQRSGSGFLGSALTTAAGVAGGLVAGNALMSLFSGSHSFGGSAGFGGAAAGSRSAGAVRSADQGYVDQGTWTDPAGGGSADPGYVDSGTWDTSSSDQSPTDNSGAIPAGTAAADRPTIRSDPSADRAVTRGRKSATA